MPIDKGYTLTIIGDGPEKPMLQKMVEENSIQNTVHFLGFQMQHEIAEHMQIHEILIVPSLIEPFGTVVTEGIASGCKVITSDAGGLPEAGNGFAKIFKVGDYNKLAELIADSTSFEKPDPIKLQDHLEKMKVDYTADCMVQIFNKIRANA